MRRAALTALSAALALAGCSSKPPSSVPPSNSGRALIYVAVGASETVGFGADDPLSQAWPQVLFHTALPRAATFINLGIPGETVAGAITDEAPDAVALAPDLVTVWLNVNDALRLVTPAAYESQLDTLVHTLRRGGKTAVLLADTPPLDHLPAYLDCLPPSEGGDAGRPGVQCRIPDGLQTPSPATVRSVVAAYSAAAARVAAKEGAVLVKLSTAVLAARAAGTEAKLYGSDGFHPSTQGHQEVAAAFAAALQGVTLP